MDLRKTIRTRFTCTFQWFLLELEKPEFCLPPTSWKKVSKNFRSWVFLRKNMNKYAFLYRKMLLNSLKREIRKSASGEEASIPRAVQQFSEDRITVRSYLWELRRSYSVLFCTGVDSITFYETIQQNEACKEPEPSPLFREKPKEPSSR